MSETSLALSGLLNSSTEAESVILAVPNLTISQRARVFSKIKSEKAQITQYDLWNAFTNMATHDVKSFARQAVLFESINRAFAESGLVQSVDKLSDPEVTKLRDIYTKRKRNLDEMQVQEVSVQ